MKKPVAAVLTPVISFIILYIIQFLLVPLIYGSLVHGGTNEGDLILCITDIIIIGGGMFFFADKMRFWLLTFPINISLMILYSKPGIYGIGIVGWFNAAHYDEAYRIPEIMIFSIIKLLSIVLIWGVVKIVKIIMRRIGKNESSQ